MNIEEIEFTLHELVYIKATLIQYRTLQQHFGIKQDPDYADVMNKLSEKIKAAELLED